MITLGIETSCDETAVAVFDTSRGLIGESVFSQIDMHAEYGGVVPELASRDHCLKILSVLEDSLGDINISEIDQVAYTAGPGLLGALLVGESFAHGLSAGLGIPSIPIHHLEAHLMAPALDFDDISFPFISSPCSQFSPSISIWCCKGCWKKVLLIKSCLFYLKVKISLLTF
mgnify:CR=1 FL=1